MNSSIIDIESWYIPIDIIITTFTTIAIGLTILYLFVILFDKACHTIPMLLVANSCLTAFLFGCIMLSSFIIMLNNDLKQIYYPNSYCIFQAYISYATCAAFNYSFVLQALYRYIFVIYPRILFWQKRRTQMLFVFKTWILGFACPLMFLFNNGIVYNYDNQVCQLPLRFSFSVIYISFTVYGIPVTLIIFIYFKLLRYVQETSKNVASINVLSRARRELKMIRKIVILVSILIGVGFVYTIFLIMSFFDRLPKYHFRIAYVFGSSSFLLVIMTLFQFTDPLKISLGKLLNIRPNIIIPTTIFTNR
ncbi:unnamed protein product [Adineta steineri]|uniref:G-protein coupled receptors family 1 profile domain-containing protein n=1 Tax=Adineta steineri TaxID=433720 RepID=A0A815YP47_9BILA|nr:unnamed protein product [Adineta steineri]CAF1573659.1 unnamed protein product [Adineta steineri]CAF1670173.1 unnamed protein product [Adineta steineri]CAF1670179.1 unnamed protein product [Adineta steineri]